MSELKWYRGKKGGPVGAIPDIGLLDPKTPIQPRDAEHEAAILATGFYEEAPAPKVKDPEPEAETTTAPPASPAKGGK